MAEEARARRKVRTGVVVSNKMDKTIVVAVEYRTTSCTIRLMKNHKTKAMMKVTNARSVIE